MALHKWAANSLKWWMKLWANRDGKRTEKENASLFDWQMTIVDAHNADNSQCRLNIPQHPEAEPIDIFNRCSLHFSGPHWVSRVHITCPGISCAYDEMCIDDDWLQRNIHFNSIQIIFLCFAHFLFVLFSISIFVSFTTKRMCIVCQTRKNYKRREIWCSYRCHYEIDKQFTRNCHLVIHKLKRRKSSNNNNVSEFENACVWANHTSLMAYFILSLSLDLSFASAFICTRRQACGTLNAVCVCVFEWSGNVTFANVFPLSFAYFPCCRCCWCFGHGILFVEKCARVGSISPTLSRSLQLNVGLTSLHCANEVIFWSPAFSLSLAIVYTINELQAEKNCVRRWLTDFHHMNDSEHHPESDCIQTISTFFPCLSLAASDDGIGNTQSRSMWERRERVKKLKVRFLVQLNSISICGGNKVSVSNCEMRAACVVRNMKQQK